MASGIDLSYINIGYTLAEYSCDRTIMYGKSSISNSLPAAISHRGRLHRAGHNRGTSAIFVKEARAQEHIYITRGAIRMRRRYRRCTLRLARPTGSRWLSPITLLDPSIFPVSLSPRSCSVLQEFANGTPRGYLACARARPSSVLEDTFGPRTNCTSTSLAPHQKRLI